MSSVRISLSRGGIARWFHAALERLGLAGSPPGEDIYHAFISYNRAADGAIAKALHAGLQRFGKPWYQTRALRVFRDDSSLSAQPSLWSSIAIALDRTRYFVLLASPESAASRWVGREIDRWIAEPNRRRRLLIALTEGDITWDWEAADFDWSHTTALPRNLSGVFESAPRHVDLRWARTSESLSLSYPDFREAVADLAATVRGVPKDVLAGEDVRQHRRTVRIARAAALSLLVLTAAAVLFGIFALQQRDSARRTARAERAVRLAATAVSRSGSEPELAMLAAVEALRQDDSTEVRSALAKVLEERRGRLVGFAGARPIGFSADGRFFALHVDPGEVHVRRGQDGVLVWRTTADSSQVASPETGSVSRDGSRVALDATGLTRIYSRSHIITLSIGRDPGPDLDRYVLRTAFLPGGNRLVALVERVRRGPNDRVLGLQAETWDIAKMRRVGTVVHLPVPGALPIPAVRRSDLGTVALSATGRRVGVLDAGGIAHVVDTRSGDELLRLSLGPGVIALDGDGSRLAWRGDSGQVVFVDVATGERVETRGGYTKRTGGAVAITLSADGKRAVGWWVADQRQPTEAFLQTWELEGLAAGLHWTSRIFANRPIDVPVLNAPGDRLLAGPGGSSPETVLATPEPGSVILEGVTGHALTAASDGIVAAGASDRPKVVRIAGARVFQDPAVNSDTVADIAPVGRGIRIVQKGSDWRTLELVGLPSARKRPLAPPPNKAANFTRGVLAGDAVVGWDELCHWCGLAQLYVWDASTGRERGIPIGGKRIRIGSRAISSGGVKGVTGLRLDGRLLAAALVDVGRASGRNDLFLIDPATGALARRLQGIGPRLAAGPIAANAGGTRLAVTSPGGGISVLDPRNGRTLVPPAHPVSGVQVAAFTFVGEDRLIALYPRALVVLDSRSGRQIGATITMRAAATDVVADPMHRRLIVRIQDSTGSALMAIPDLVLADTDAESLARAACMTLGRNLTQSEWDGLLTGSRRHRTCPQLPPDDPALTPIHLR